jgi:hypothetical protein
MLLLQYEMPNERDLIKHEQKLVKPDKKLAKKNKAKLDLEKFIKAEQERLEKEIKKKEFEAEQEKIRLEQEELAKKKVRYPIADFLFNGVIHEGDIRYTYYSQSVLPGGALQIPGRHIEDGYVVDGEGYIVVACDFIAKGTIINTPLGEAKVYDCGAGDNTVDIYVA